jgi:hypothetical protein
VKNSSTLLKRAAQASLAIGLAVSGGVFAAGSPAMATTRLIDRSGCWWTATSVTQEAKTIRRTDHNDCAGHGWVMAKIDGHWSTWDHSLAGGRIVAPNGHPIQQSRHTSCSGCSEVTLAP